MRDKERRTASANRLDPAHAGSKRSLGFAFVDCADEEVARLLLVFLGSCSSADFLPQHLFKTGEEEAMENKRAAGDRKDETRKQRKEETEGKEGSSLKTPAWRKLMVEYAVEDARQMKIKVCRGSGRCQWSLVFSAGLSCRQEVREAHGSLACLKLRSACAIICFISSFGPSQEERRRAYLQLVEAQRQQVAKEEGLEDAEGEGAMPASRRPKKMKTYSRGESGSLWKERESGKEQRGIAWGGGGKARLATSQ